MADPSIVQAAYAGAQDAGLRIAGIAEVESETVSAGSRDAPVELGERITVTVREAGDGRLLPRRGDASSDDPAATALLRIEVAPTMLFDDDHEPQLVWVAHARRIDVATSRIVATGASGPLDAELTAWEAGRPYHEYMNDPTYRSAVVEAHARDPRTAVAQAIERLGPASTSGPPPTRRHRAVALVAAAAVLAVGAVVAAVALTADEAAAPTMTTPPATATSPPTSASPAPTESTATTSDSAATTATAPTTTPTSTVPTTTAPAAFPDWSIAVARVDVSLGAQDTGETWDIPAVDRIGTFTLEPVTFMVVWGRPAPDAGADDPIDLLMFAVPPGCDADVAAPCSSTANVQETYVFIGADQVSTAVSFGEPALPFERTFLDGSVIVGDALSPDCSIQVGTGRLPTTGADRRGGGLYRANADDRSLTDSIFTEFSGSAVVASDQPIVAVVGERTSVAVGGLDDVPSCMSSFSFAAPPATLPAVFADPLPVSSSGVPIPDGTILGWSEIADAVRTMPPSEERDDLLAALDGGGGPGPGHEQLVATAVAVALTR